MPQLWVLRENLGLTGTKFGCGIAQCGACTVQLDGRRAARVITRPERKRDRFRDEWTDGVAVVADSWDRAQSALDAMAIEWNFGPDGDVSSATQAAEAARLLDTPGTPPTTVRWFSRAACPPSRARCCAWRSSAQWNGCIGRRRSLIKRRRRPIATIRRILAGAARHQVVVHGCSHSEPEDKYVLRRPTPNGLVTNVRYCQLADMNQGKSPIVPFGPELYEVWRNSELGARTEELEQALILKLATPVSGARLLDIGCGDGALAVTLQHRGANAMALDASWPMLHAAQKGAARSQADLPLCQGRAESLPFSDNTFDLVVAVTILCFVSAPGSVFSEIHRVLRPGGRLVIGELGRWSTWAVARRVRGWFGSPLWREGRFRTASELKELARDSGLVPIRVEGAIFYPRWSLAARYLARLDRWLGTKTTFGAAFLALAAEKKA